MAVKFSITLIKDKEDLLIYILMYSCFKFARYDRAHNKTIIKREQKQNTEHNPSRA